MAQAKGAASKVLLDFETVYGQDPESPAAMAVPFNYPLDLGGEEPLKPSETHQNRRDAAEPYYDNHDVKGTATVPVDVRNFGYWLRALLGPPVTGPPAEGIYTHVFKPADSLESLVLEKGFADIDQYFKYNGVKVGKMSLDITGKGGDVVAKLDLMGALETLGGSPYDSDPMELTLEKFQMRQAVIKEAGSPAANVRSLTLEIDNGLDGDTFVVAGGGIRGALNEGDCLVSGKLSAMFENETLYNKAVEGTETSLEIILTSGDYSLSFLIPELKLSRKSPSIVKGGAWVEPDFQAYYANSPQGAIIQVTLANDHESYAEIDESS